MSPDVKEALLERERLVQGLQDEEEARMRASASVIHFTSLASATTNVETEQLRAAGTLYETVDANAKWGKRVDYHDREKMLREAELMRRAQLVRKLDKKLEFVSSKYRYPAPRTSCPPPTTFVCGAMRQNASRYNYVLPFCGVTGCEQFLSRWPGVTNLFRNLLVGGNVATTDISIGKSFVSH